MSDSRRQYRAIKNAVKQLYPLPFGHFEGRLANYHGPGILPAILVGVEDRWASNRQRLRNG